MLSVARTGWLSRRYRVLEGESIVGELELPLFGSRFALRIGDAPWTVSAEGWFRCAFALAGEDGRTVARARRGNVFGREYRVDVADRPYRLAAESWFRRAFVLAEANRVVGRFDPEGAFSCRMRVELPAQFSLPVQAFLAAIVQLEWRRQAAAAAS